MTKIIFQIPNIQPDLWSQLTKEIFEDEKGCDIEAEADDFCYNHKVMPCTDR